MQADLHTGLRRFALLMMKIRIIFQCEFFFRTAILFQRLIAPVYKSEKAVDQGVDKLIFIGQQCLFVVDIEDFGRCDFIALHLQNQIGMLRQMLDGFLADAAGKFHRNDFLYIFNSAKRLAYGQVQIRQIFFNHVDPFSIH